MNEDIQIPWIDTLDRRMPADGEITHSVLTGLKNWKGLYGVP